VAEHLDLEQRLGEAAQIDREERAAGATRGGVQPLRHDLLAGAVLAADQHVGVGRRHARHQLDHWPHRDRLGDHLRHTVPPQHPVFVLEAAGAPQGAPQLDLSAQRGEEPGVVPRLLDEIPSPPAHRLDGLFDAAPRRHHDGRKSRIEALELGNELQAFTAGGGIARVVEVEEDGVEIGALYRGQDGGR
jgi:hypothetical protein